MYYVYKKSIPEIVLGWFPEYENALEFKKIDDDNRFIEECNKRKNTFSKEKDNYSYLNVFSKQTKEFVINEVNNGNVNIYHSIMSVLGNRYKAYKLEEFQFEFDNYMKKKKFSSDKKNMVEEIFSYCYNRIVNNDV